MEHTHLKEPIARHILPCSATMVGVCMTSISLVKILEGRIGPSRVDEYLALNSVIFLISGIFAYMTLRAHADHHMIKIFERVADVFFIVGLVVLVGISILFAYEGI